MDGAADRYGAWDNPSFVRYLRASKPAKAAEVIDALQNDPTFFQQAPPAAAGSPGDPSARAPDGRIQEGSPGEGAADSGAGVTCASGVEAR